MNELERVKEEMAKRLYNSLGNSHLTWQTCKVRGIYRQIADQILSIPGLCIESDNQELPVLIVRNADGKPDGLDEFGRGQWYGQELMVKGNFRRVIE